MLQQQKIIVDSIPQKNNKCKQNTYCQINLNPANSNNTGWGDQNCAQQKKAKTTTTKNRFNIINKNRDN